MKRLCFLWALAFGFASATPLGAQWAEKYWVNVTTPITHGNQACQTPDGGFIVSGDYYTTDNMYEGLVFKVDSAGTIQWRFGINQKRQDWVNSLQPTQDGGCILGTSSASPAGMIIKLGSDGAVQWKTSVGGEVLAVIQTKEGGFAVLTSDWDWGGKLFITKLSASGEARWTCRSGFKLYYSHASIRQTPDGGYVVACGFYTDSDNFIHIGIFKLDTQGRLEWQKKIAGLNYDDAIDIQTTPDGGFILAGSTASFGAGDRDIWILKLTTTGGIEWQKTYGNAGNQDARGVARTRDGGYAVVCTLFDDDDFSLLKLRPNGDVEWGQTYIGAGGGRMTTVLVQHSIQETLEGGFITACEAGDGRMLVLNLLSTGMLDGPCNSNIKEANVVVLDSTAVPIETAMVQEVFFPAQYSGGPTLNPVDLQRRAWCGPGSGKKGYIRR